MLRIAYFVFFILLVIPCVSLAESKIIFAEHKYVMGDNDSKNDARRMCFLEAKRRVLEKAGTYIESRTEVKNFRLTKDEISVYAAALLKVDTVNEEWKFIGENMAILISVKAEVDMNSVENQLAKIKQDTSIQEKLKDQYAKLQELERKISQLQKNLVPTDKSVALYLRKERITTFGEISRIEAKYAHILNLIKDRRSASVEQAKLILNYIEVDMTKKEVEYILGKPDEEGNDLYFGEVPYIAYGKFFIYFSKSDLVSRIGFKTSDKYTVIIKDRGYNILVHGLSDSPLDSRVFDYYQREWLACFGDCQIELKNYVLGK